ncbi:MAG TPA: hypothetical protein VE734_13505, partial [Terriglobales bacterium]|nr:hypothetical protein [Terriglobales bacterium]
CGWCVASSDVARIQGKISQASSRVFCAVVLFSRGRHLSVAGEALSQCNLGYLCCECFLAYTGCSDPLDTGRALAREASGRTCPTAQAVGNVLLPTTRALAAPALSAFGLLPRAPRLGVSKKNKNCAFKARLCYKQIFEGHKNLFGMAESLATAQGMSCGFPIH